MKKLPLLPTLFGVLVFSLTAEVRAQVNYGQGTSLPPRGYVLPPPPGYSPQSERRRADNDDPPVKPRPASSDAKPTKAEVTPTKKKTSEVAKTTSKTPEKKPAVVAKSSSKTDSKTDSKKSVAKNDPPKKSTDKEKSAASSKAVAANTTKKKDPTPEPVSKSSAKAIASAEKPVDKPADKSVKTTKPEIAKMDLGESPRDLHAPATNLTSPKATATKAPDAESVAIGPPVLLDASVSGPKLKERGVSATETNTNAVVTNADALPNAVRKSAAMMPLAMPASDETGVFSKDESPAEPDGISAADHAAQEMRMALASAPRAAIVSSAQALPLDDVPPETVIAPNTEPSGGGRLAQKETLHPDAPKAEIFPERSEPKSKQVAATMSVEPPLPVEQPTRPDVKSMPIVKPSMASVQPANYRPGTPAQPRQEAIDFPAEAKFSDPDTPPPAKPAPVVKLAPSLGGLSIDAERADSETEKNRFTFNGNVTMSCTRFTLKADQVIANMQSSEGEESSGGVQKVVSEGHVIVNMNAPDGNGPGYVATGNQAIYDPEKETLRIMGWPKIEEGNKALIASSAATEILIDTKTGRLTTTGSTKTMIK